MKKVLWTVITLISLTTVAHANQITYTAIKNDTAYSIANRFNISVDELVEYNSHWIRQVNGDVTLIPIGIELNIKSPVKISNASAYNKVQEKKELTTITKKEKSDNKYLIFTQGDDFSKRVLNWCKLNDTNCLWESKYNFKIQAEVSYDKNTVKENLELLARDLYLNRSKVKIQYYRVNDVYRFYN